MFYLSITCFGCPFLGSFHVFAISFALEFVFRYKQGTETSSKLQTAALFGRLDPPDHAPGSNDASIINMSITE